MLEAGDRVRHLDTGDVGNVLGLARLQAGPGVTPSNPLYRVRFERLAGLRDVAVKVTARRLRPTPSEAGPAC